jgi:hypothetical protein
MAAIGISEFTFGYAFLYEQTHSNWANLKAAPVLPSLQQEQDVGWDAHLPLNGIDFYYQFKLSDHLSRSNAAFISDGTYATPYYRVALHRRNLNAQHQRLREHSKTSPHTYYVAPEFDTIDDFNAAFLARQITQRSRLIRLEDCEDITDGAQHYITFRSGSVTWLQHSERRSHDHSFSGAQLEQVYRNTSNAWRPVEKSFVDELFDKAHEVVKKRLYTEERRAKPDAVPLLDFNPRQSDRREVLLRTSQILSVMLGLTLVLVGSAK